MKKFLHTTALFASTLLLATACKKNDNNNEQPQDNSRDMINAFFKQNAPQAEVFTVNAGTGGTITTSKGTKFFISPNAFKDVAGNVVSGNIQFSAKEFGQASDMILGDKPAMTAGGIMLRSFGEFNVGAEQNNNPLQVRNDTAVRVQVPARPAAGAQLPLDAPMWDGDTSITVTQNGYNDDNQMTTVSQTVSVRKGVDWQQLPGNNALLGGGGYNFKLDSLFQWRNCDVLYNPGGTKTTVLGYFGNKYNPSTTQNYMGQEPSMLFFKVRNQNTVVKLYNTIFQPSAGKEGFLSYQNTFTVGEQGTFLAISAKDNKFYAEMRDVTIPAPAAGKNYVPYTFNLQEVSQSQLLSLIQQMNTK